MTTARVAVRAHRARASIEGLAVVFPLRCVAAHVEHLRIASLARRPTSHWLERAHARVNTHACLVRRSVGESTLAAARARPVPHVLRRIRVPVEGCGAAVDGAAKSFTCPLAECICIAPIDEDDGKRERRIGDRPGSGLEAGLAGACRMKRGRCCVDASEKLAVVRVADFGAVDAIETFDPHGRRSRVARTCCIRDGCRIHARVSGGRRRHDYGWIAGLRIAEATCLAAGRLGRCAARARYRKRHGAECGQCPHEEPCARPVHQNQCRPERAARARASAVFGRTHSSTTIHGLAKMNCGR